MNELMCITTKSLNKFHVFHPYITVFRQRRKYLCLRCGKKLNEKQFEQYKLARKKFYEECKEAASRIKV